MKTTISVIQRNMLLLAALLLVPSFAHAHTGMGSTHGFMHGFAHPLGGLDHICAMVAVGLWAAQMGGRAIWVVPATFVSVMAFGGALGMAGVGLPFVEKGIVLSLLVLGVLIAASARLPLVASAIIVGLFALCHGHAHGTEMPHTASGFLYGMGFLVATILLHATGIGAGVLTQHMAKPLFVRLAGAAVAICGLVLWLS